MQISLRNQLLLTVIPFLLMLALFGGAGVLVMFHLGNEIDEILKENYDSILAMKQMNESVERIDSSFQFVLAGNEGDSKKIYSENWSIYLRQMEIEKRNITVMPEEPVLVDQLAKLTDQYRKLGDRFYSGQEGLESRKRIYFSTGDSPGLLPIFKEIKEHIKSIHDVNEMQMHLTSEKAKALAQVSFFGFLTGLTIATLVSLGIVWWLNKVILGPIQGVTEAAQAIGKGQLHLSVPVFGKGELGQLAVAFNSMTQKIREYRQTNTENLLRARNTGQATINSFADPIIVLDLGGGVEVANPAARNLFGLENPREGVPHTLWVPPESLKETIDACLRQQRPVLTETFDEAVHFRVDGDERTYLPQARPIRTPEGETLGVAIVLNDVTRFRLLNRLKSDWVATVSHELKTPLTSVRLAVHVLLEEIVGPLEPKQVELLLEARESTERLFRLIEHLLALAKLEEGGEPLELLPMDPQVVLRNAADRALSRAEDKRITILVDETFDLPKVNIDENRFARALNNLLDNALTYTEPGGKITLSARSEKPGFVEMVVSDTGIGIPDQYVDRIFDRFFQVPEREHSPGTGLGLAIVQEVVHAHHGEIHCESSAGKGTTFRIILPVCGGKP